MMPYRQTYSWPEEGRGESGEVGQSGSVDNPPKASGFGQQLGTAVSLMTHAQAEMPTFETVRTNLGSEVTLV